MIENNLHHPEILYSKTRETEFKAKFILSPTISKICWHRAQQAIMPDSDPARQVHVWDQEGAFYNKEAAPLRLLFKGYRERFF